MRRTVCTLVLASLVGLTFAACGSSADTSTGGPSTTAGGSTTTTKKDAPVMGPKCLAVSAMLQAFLAVNSPTDKDKVSKAVDTSVAKLKDQEPKLYEQAAVDGALPYLHKMAAGETPTAAEKDAGTKTKDAINLYFNTTCKKAGPANPPGKASSTTTAATTP